MKKQCPNCYGWRIGTGNNCLDCGYQIVDYEINATDNTKQDTAIKKP